MLTLGCSYSVFSNQLPHLKNIYIVPIENSSEEVNIEVEMFDNISNEFVTDGRLRIVSQLPDCELECKILDYKDVIYTYDQANNVKEYQVKILFSVKFIDMITNEIVYERPNLLKTERYPADEDDPDYTDSTVINEYAAREEIFKDIFRDIMSNTLEAW